MAEQMPNWMQRFQQQDLDEEKEEIVTPVKLLDPNGRSFIWWLCKQYGVTSDGGMGQACNLLERYISKKIKHYSYLQPRSTEWCKLKQEMARRVPLLASVCIALTTKMMSSERQLQATAIRDVLAQLGITKTLPEINAAELDVLSSVGFCIPLFTNVEKALMMAVDVGMTVLLEGVALVTELAEYYRSVIQEEIIGIAFSMREDNNLQRQNIANVRHIHLVAGAVIATGLFLTFSGPDPIPRLCFLTQSSRVYIKCIGDLIHSRLMLECGAVQPSGSRKRKLPMDDGTWNDGNNTS